MSTATVLSAPPARADNEAKPTEYTVKNGDTCPSIAAAFFGDVKRVDLVHVLNPQLGPVPHHLKEGQILLLPPKPTPEVAGPDAKLTRVRNAVEVRAPDPRVGKVDDPLYRGNRVGTKDASAADLTFRDETQVRLGENTLVVIFGDTNASAARANAAETTLVTGSLRARLSEIAGRKTDKPRVETASGAVVMKAGEAQVSVDHQQATRLAVYQGGSTVTAQRRTVPVDDGFGSKAEMGKVPTPPRPLPAAPVWSALPSALVLTDADTGDVTGSYAPGQGPGDPAAEWHVQLARDVDFADVVVDVHVPLATVALAAQKVPPGSYAVRVSAIDADAFEGKWGAVATFAVSRVVLDPLPARRTRVSTPDKALACVVDGGPPLAFPFEVERNADRTLSCTSGTATSLLALPQLPIVHVSARADLLRQGVLEGTLRVRVTDAKGELL
ncbi:MAG TPA: FecR domain-containing protein, partial [Labilithrix sp.]|nr:FecR domain-containing protein [Labilithrix sp.]